MTAVAVVVPSASTASWGSRTSVIWRVLLVGRDGREARSVLSRSTRGVASGDPGATTEDRRRGSRGPAGLPLNEERRGADPVGLLPSLSQRRRPRRSINDR